MLFVGMANPDPVKLKEGIETYKNVNPSLASMLQDVLNKLEEKEGKPLTKVIEKVIVDVGKCRTVTYKVVG